MVRVLNMFITPEKDYIESFYSVAGNSILHFRTKFVGDDQEINELCSNKEQIIKLRNFLNLILESE